MVIQSEDINCFPIGPYNIQAPEVIKREECRLSKHQLYNEASDWWSYGCLIYEMTTGKRAFNGLSQF